MTRQRFFMALMIWMLLLVGCSRGHQTSYDFLSKAQEYHQKGDNKAALIDLKNALQEDPKNGEARYLMAVIHNERGDGSAAEIELDKALKLGVAKNKVMVALGKALLLQGEYKKVLQKIDLSGGISGTAAAEILAVRGDAFLGLHKDDSAKESFSRAVKMDPGYSDAYVGFAQLAAVQKKPKEALRQIGIALEKSPKNLPAWFLKARILRSTNKDQDARAAYEHILSLDKRNILAQLNLASLDMAAGHLGAARAKVEAASKIDPANLQLEYLRAQLHYREKKYSEARDDLQEVMKAVPGFLPGALLSGAVYYQLGLYEQAHQYLTSFLGQVPGDVFAENLLIATDLQLNQPAEALKSLGPLLEKMPKNAQVLALAGEAYMQTKDYAKATEYLSRASAIQPKNAGLRTQLGASRLGLGKTQQAIQDLESAAAMGTDNGKADALLVVAYMNKGKYDKALTAAQSWQKKQPKNPIAYFLEGKAYAAQGYLGKSRKYFQKSVEIKPDYFPAVLVLAQLDLKKNNPRAAKKDLEGYLKIDKQSVEAMLALAQISAVQKQWPEYVHWLKQAAEAKPNAIPPRARLADYYLANHDKNMALEVAQKAVTDNPNSATALVLLGATQSAAKDNKAALATYTKLVQMVPNVPLAYLQLAQAQVRDNKETAARVSLKKALKLNPDFSQALDALIRLDLAHKNWAAAIKVARDTQMRQPTSPVGYDREGDILMAQKHYGQAIKVYEQALTKGGGSVELIKLHRAMRIAGAEKAADQRLTSWIKRYPQDIMVRDYAGEYYMGRHRDRDAIAQYEALRKLEPKNVLILNNLANLYQREGDSRALIMAEQAFKGASDSPEVQDTLGWILVGEGKLDRGIKLLREAASNQPKSGSIHYHLAVALSRSRKKDDAKKELQAAIHTGRKFPELGQAKAMLKDLEK